MSRQAFGAEVDILVIDNHDLVREAIRYLLAQASFGRVRTRATLEADESSKNPDVIVVDPLFLGPPLDAPRIVEEITRRYSRSKVLVLTHWDSPVGAQRCMAAGAHGYLLKRAGARDLIDAVQRVATGEEYLQPSLGALLAKRPLERAVGRKALNETERAVLRALALGHTNAEASRMLNFGVRTVEGYRSRIMKKLGLKTRADIVRAAVEMGLMSSTDPLTAPASSKAAQPG